MQTKLFGLAPGLNQGFGSVPGLNQGFGSVPGLNQGFGSVPGLNQGFGSFPGLNQGFGSFPGLNQGFGSVTGLNQGFGSVTFSPVDSDLFDTDQPKNALKIEMSILSIMLLIIGISNCRKNYIQNWAIEHGYKF